MSKLKGVLQFSILILISLALLWLALRNIEVGTNESKMGFLVSVWKSSNKSYLILSGVLALVSHFVRAERWKLQLNPTGHTLTLKHSFLSVMQGYFINLAIPRAGEISRCYNLYRLNKTPVDLSFGTVVAERIVDLVILLTLISIAFVIELDTLGYFFEELDLPFSEGYSQVWTLAGIGLGVLGIIVLAYFLVLNYFKSKLARFFVKVRNAIRGIKTGLLTIFSLEKRGLFILYSLLIWVLYYLMSYAIILAFPETQDLGLIDTLIIFVIGGIAMAIPLPGGTGSYHVLVPLGMGMLFGIAKDEATAFSFIFHGWQTAIVIVFGLLSMIISQYLIKKHSSGDEK